MSKIWQNLNRTISKPILFGLWGAGGCFLASLFGEILLDYALPSPVVSVVPTVLQVDIMFVLDITNSMDEEINGVKKGIQQLAQALSVRNLDAKIGLIAFGDRLNGEEPQILQFPDVTFTSDPQTFSEKVGDLKQVHGGDSPEGIALAIIMGQNAYLRCRFLSISEGLNGIFGSFAAGIIAGALGQLIFVPFSTFIFLILLGRIIGWILLGGILGGGMSLIVPNLKTLRGIQSGSIGGLAGAGGFFLMSQSIGEIGGRLLGGTILGFFIGLMIALIEQLTREALLLIHWNQAETTTLSLGDTPITMGTSNKAHIPLSKAQVYFPETAKIFSTSGRHFD